MLVDDADLIEIGIELSIKRRDALLLVDTWRAASPCNDILGIQSFKQRNASPLENNFRPQVFGKDLVSSMHSEIELQACGTQLGPISGGVVIGKANPGSVNDESLFSSAEKAAAILELANSKLEGSLERPKTPIKHQNSDEQNAESPISVMQEVDQIKPPSPETCILHDTEETGKLDAKLDESSCVGSPSDDAESRIDPLLDLTEVASTILGITTPTRLTFESTVSGLSTEVGKEHSESSHLVTQGVEPIKPFPGAVSAASPSIQVKLEALHSLPPGAVIPGGAAMVPAGKYKGSSFNYVKISDPGYCAWVCSNVTGGPMSVSYTHLTLPTIYSV